MVIVIMVIIHMPGNSSSPTSPTLSRDLLPRCLPTQCHMQALHHDDEIDDIGRHDDDDGDDDDDDNFDDIGNDDDYDER